MSAVISSRTPEGEPTRCPICGVLEAIEPSLFGGDAPCPSCGHLLWPRATSAADRLPRTRRSHAEAMLRSEPRRPMFGVAATLARQVRRVIRAARRRVPTQASPESSGVYDHWLDG
jgi:hypothetical protein